MGLFDALGRGLNNIANNFASAPPEAYFALGDALSGNPRDLGRGLTAGLGAFNAASQEAKKKQGLAQMLGGMQDGIPEAQRPLFQYLAQNNPDMVVQGLASRLFAKPTESWQDVDKNNDGVPDAQRNSLTGEYKPIDTPLSMQDRLRLAAAGRSSNSTTINNMPAELGAKIGLAEGFLSSFDNIKARAEKFYGAKGIGEQAKNRAQLLFNTGEGGKLWRDVEIGKESLVRILTGAGMPESEARDTASKYSIGADDTQFDALSKLDNLKNALVNTASGAYRARGATYNQPAQQGSQATTGWKVEVAK